MTSLDEIRKMPENTFDQQAVKLHLLFVFGEKDEELEKKMRETSAFSVPVEADML